MNQDIAQPVGRKAAFCSFACLGAQAVWVVLCFLFVDQIDQSDAPGSVDHLVRGWLAVLAAVFFAFAGVCFLSAVGTAFGVAARRSVWGVLALILNALVFLCTGGSLLLLFLTP